MAEIEVVQGDITKVTCRAIVNAANSSLLGGSGVDGAIHAAAGPALLAECRTVAARQGGCATGEAVITGAGALDADYVIHTVGPVWNSGSENLNLLLAQCYENSLQLAHDYSVQSIAFPNISTGVYRFPKALAAQVAIQAVQDKLASLPANSALERVLFVCFDPENTALYQELQRIGGARGSETR